MMRKKNTLPHTRSNCNQTDKSLMSPHKIALPPSKHPLPEPPKCDCEFVNILFMFGVETNHSQRIGFALTRYMLQATQRATKHSNQTPIFQLSENRPQQTNLNNFLLRIHQTIQNPHTHTPTR